MRLDVNFPGRKFGRKFSTITAHRWIKKNAEPPVFRTKITAATSFLGEITAITTVYRKFPPINYHPYRRKKQRTSNRYNLSRNMPIKFRRCRSKLTAEVFNFGPLQLASRKDKSSEYN